MHPNVRHLVEREAQEKADKARRLAAEAERRGMHVEVAADLASQPGQTATTKTAENEPTRDDAAQLGDSGEQAEIRLNAKSLDPGEEAGNILDAEQVDGIPRLRFWRGTFWRWDGGRYMELSTAEARAGVVTYLNRRYTQVVSHITSDVVDQLRAQAILSSQTEPPAWLEPRDDDPPVTELLSARNGLIHLPSLIAGDENLIPSSARFFTTTALDYDFDPSADCPRQWLSFLDQLWHDDPQSIATLQEWFGYCLVPDTSQQKILLLIGPKRSGKGTIARVLRQLVGQGNVAGPVLSSLATNFGLWPVIGKTLAIISDARLSARTDQAVITERLLSISGEDALTVDRKNLEPVTAKLSARFMILTNELPGLNDSSGALSSRMILLRLSESFYGREDPFLTTRLLPELPGILLWSIDGWRRLRERGRFQQPDSGKQLQSDLDDLGSPVGAFVRDRCQLGPEYQTSIDDLFEAWQRWCDQKKRKDHGTQQRFGRDLISAVPSLEHVRPRDGSRRYRAYQGIGLVG